jgi:hypothetical protein
MSPPQRSYYYDATGQGDVDGSKSSNGDGRGDRVQATPVLTA